MNPDSELAAKGKAGLNRRAMRLVPDILSGSQRWIAVMFFTTVVIASTYLYWQRLYKSADDYRDQLLHAGAADEYVELLRKESPNPGKPTVLSFYRAAKKFNAFYPESDTYILNSSGYFALVLSEFSQPGSDSVPIAPLVAFLQNKSLANGPIYNTDPVYLISEVFSAAELKVVGFEGYVYIILHNRMRNLATIPWLESGHWLNSLRFTVQGMAFLSVMYWIARLFFRRVFGRVTRMVGSLAPDLSKEALATASHGDFTSYENSIVELVAAIAKDRTALKGQAEEVKQVISRVSHDFRTPLLLIQDYAERLMTRDIPAPDGDNKREAERLKRNVKSLESLLSDLDAFDRLRGERMPINRDLCRLDELCHDLISTYAFPAEAGGLAIRVDSPEELPPVLADVGLIERSLRNLFDNAIRHTPRGGTIELRLLQPDSSHVRVEVADTGTGIPAAELPNIFRPFHQVYRQGQKNGSSGLGLAIVERVVQAHGSKIVVESKEGVGSTFRFDLMTAEFEENREKEISSRDPDAT